MWLIYNVASKFYPIFTYNFMSKKLNTNKEVIWQHSK